jgi:hypothetical protein
VDIFGGAGEEDGINKRDQNRSKVADVEYPQNLPKRFAHLFSLSFCIDSERAMGDGVVCYVVLSLVMGVEASDQAHGGRAPNRA